MDVAAAVSSIELIQGTLSALTALSLTGFLWPQSVSVSDGASFDYIIVGGGTAGTIIANRLTEIENVTVLLIEAGGDPPVEAMLPGLFPYQPKSAYDWNLTSIDGGYTTQNHKDNVIQLPQGKMLGGSSSLDHMIYVRGNPKDYDPWVEATGDDSWSFDGLYNYFKKSERLEDAGLLESQDADFFGVDGYLGLSRQTHDVLLPYLGAFEELGFDILLTSNGNNTLGYTQPMYSITKYRESAGLAFLTPVKDRSNLSVKKNTFVKKIIFDGTVAIGVETINDDNESLSFYANKEVIISAGTFNSAKLLMLSGIGPKENLQSMNIDIIADLPVGQNLQDHVPVMILHQMEEAESSAVPTDPRQFPVPCFTGYVAMDKSETKPDYQAIGLIFPHDSSSLLAFCSVVFSYKDDICQAMFDASAGRTILYTVHNLLHPKSRGQVLLQSSDYNDAPLIDMGLFKNEDDLENLAQYVEDYVRVTNTTYFQSVGAELVNLNLPECADLEFQSSEYWRCYTAYMAATMYHYSSTASMGSVVDSRLRVFNVTGLRVADASVMPTTISGNIKSAVMAIAEKAADMIKEDNGLS